MSAPHIPIPKTHLTILAHQRRVTQDLHIKCLRTEAHHAVASTRGASAHSPTCSSLGDPVALSLAWLLRVALCGWRESLKEDEKCVLRVQCQPWFMQLHTNAQNAEGALYAAGESKPQHRPCGGARGRGLKKDKKKLTLVIAVLLLEYSAALALVGDRVLHLQHTRPCHLSLLLQRCNVRILFLQQVLHVGFHHIDSSFEFRDLRLLFLQKGDVLSSL